MKALDGIEAQAVTCARCGRTFVLISLEQIAAWLRRGDRCPRCGGVSGGSAA